MNTKRWRPGIQISSPSVVLERMLPADGFLQEGRESLGFSEIEKSFGKINSSSSQHLSWPVSSKHLKSAGLAAGMWLHVARTEHLAHAKKQFGKHPRFCISSSTRGDRLKEEEGWQRNAFKMLESSGYLAPQKPDCCRCLTTRRGAPTSPALSCLQRKAWKHHSSKS